MGMVGVENGLAIRVYGEKGGLIWGQEERNTLILTRLDRAPDIIRTGVN